MCWASCKKKKKKEPGFISPAKKKKTQTPREAVMIGRFQLFVETSIRVGSSAGHVFDCGKKNQR